jgi:hypothetical protein
MIIWENRLRNSGVLGVQLKGHYDKCTKATKTKWRGTRAKLGTYLVKWVGRVVRHLGAPRPVESSGFSHCLPHMSSLRYRVIFRLIPENCGVSGRGTILHSARVLHPVTLAGEGAPPKGTPRVETRLVVA